VNAPASIIEDQETIVRRPFALVATLATLALLVAGCGSGNSTSAGTTTTNANAANTNSSPYGETQSTPATGTTGTTGTSPAPASAGVVIVAKHSHDGTILAAGPKRLTVYLFEADHGSASACAGACAQAWPPVTTSGAPTTGAGAVSADLGTIKRADGTTQVTYKGHPLYFFVRDKDNGDAYGQGVNAFGASWYVLKPSGVKVDNS
jgi:predicted lipoprotein with Yx(FWY)xxD motif